MGGVQHCSVEQRVAVKGNLTDFRRLTAARELLHDSLCKELRRRTQS